jgi:hypothetical protein
VAGCCKNGNEPCGSIKCGEFHDWLQNYSLPKRILLNGFSYLKMLSAYSTECKDDQ